MSKIKKSKKQNKFKEISDIKSLGYPVFCFKHLTNNKNFNFEYFKIIKEKTEAKGIILDKLIEIQNKTWFELHQMNKKVELETLSIEIINFEPNNYEFSKDQKVYVFRLNSQKWRMIGIKSGHNNDVLHIIGFDFNFSAYRH